MLLTVVVVHPRDEFDALGRRPSRRPARDEVAARGAGRELFASLACINCHTVRGTPANGVFGPDLTHLMSRTTHRGRARAEHPGDLRALGRRSRPRSSRAR